MPHCVRRGPSFPERGTAASPHFLAHVYCGETAAWIRTLLGTEVGIGAGDTELDGHPPLLRKGAQQPTHFSGFFRISNMGV